MSDRSRLPGHIPPQKGPRIAILGAGPIGLEAALAAAELGLPFTVYEAASEPAAHVGDWGHVELFTGWDLDVSPRQRRHLAAAGVEVPTGDEHPSGAELRRRVLLPVAALPAVAPHLRLGARVREVGREGLLKHEEIANAERARRPFRLLVEEADGEQSIAAADLVIDCTGTWGQPNALGDGGIAAPGEARHAARIGRHIPDLQRDGADFAGQTVLLVGAGHSAQTAARDLAAFAASNPGTKVIWALRDEQPTFAAVADDPLPARAALAAGAQALVVGSSPAVEIRRGVFVERLATGEDGRLRVTLRRAAGGSEEVAVDRILALTGAVGDHHLYRQLQVHECYASAAPMNLAAALLGGGGGSDCMAQTSHGFDTLKSPEPGFYILGAKSYGRTNTFLLRVGWEQVSELFATLAPAAAASAQSAAVAVSA